MNSGVHRRNLGVGHLALHSGAYVMACRTQEHVPVDVLVIAEYYGSDVVNTYRVWLRYELFRGKLTTQSYEASEANLQKFLEGRNNAASQTIKAIESELIVR